MSTLPTAREAIEAVFAVVPRDAAVVCANGYVSREAFGVDDRPGNFYMIGSMGLGASIAFGAALAQPQRRLVTLDGDGNLLMGLGALTVIGSHRPRNLHHVVIDNGVYASTGNQRTVAPQVSLEGIAREAGYRWARRVDDPAELPGALREWWAAEGPAFLRVLVRPQEHPREFERVSHTPVEIRDRFAGAVGGRG